MLEVHHNTICAFSRKLRIVLKEKGIAHDLMSVSPWQRDKEFLKLSPLGETPVIIDENRNVISSPYAIFEYIEEKFPHRKLLPTSLEDRARVRMLCYWFDQKFYNEVTKYLYLEKIVKTLTKNGAPNSQVLYMAKNNLKYHMEYIEFLLASDRYLFEDTITLADISAAAQLSVLDYLGDINWNAAPKAKEWYGLIKSRPSFRPILNDRIPGLTPPSYYCDPDF